MIGHREPFTGVSVEGDISDIHSFVTFCQFNIVKTSSIECKLVLTCMRCICCAISCKCTFVCTRCHALRGFLRHALPGAIMLGLVMQALSGLLLSGRLGCTCFVHLVARTSFIVLVHINSS